MSFLENFATTTGTLSPPPVNCYFHVTFFPGYMNYLKILKMGVTSFTSWRLDDTAVFVALSAVGIRLSSKAGAHSNNKAYGTGGATGAGINTLDFRFNRVSGLSNRIETEDIREGGINNEMLQLPDRVVHENLILERGFMLEGTSILTTELNMAMQSFRVIPGEILVLLNDPNGNPLSGWLFRNAYPVAWSHNDLSSDEENIFMESMEFSYTHHHQIHPGYEGLANTLL